MFKALRNNRGATLIIYVVMASVLLGFTAVAVDTGSVMVQKQRLQNAVDAAALAAAQELPNTSAARSAAEHYASINGLSPSDITITFADSNKSVVINSHKRIEYTFARILGLSSKVVTPSAKAAAASLGKAFNYALFSGSSTSKLSLNGSDYYIEGSSHTNQNFSANGSGNTITGACEAVGTVWVNGGNTQINRVPYAQYVPMPDFSETIRMQAEAAGQLYVGDRTFNSSTINVDKPIYVDGNVTINGSGFSGIGCIFATGNITFNGSSQKMSGSDSIIIYSKNGNITLNGSSAQIDGIMYAPGGTITMNGAHQVVNGRIIANSVNLNGSGIRIIGGNDEDIKCLPTNSVKLVK